MITKSINEYEKEIATSPAGSLPIFFANVCFNIVSARGRKTIRDAYTAKKIVCKGDFKGIKTSETVKKRLLFDHFGRDKKNYKKINSFDLNKIEITKVLIIHFMGYGIK